MSFFAQGELLAAINQTHYKVLRTLQGTHQTLNLYKL